MFDDISELDKVNINEIKNVDSGPGFSGSNGNQFKQNNGYNGNNNNGGNRPFFKKKEEVIEEPYVPVVIYVDRDFPPEVKTSLYNIASKLINKKITIRVNGDDKEFADRLTALSDSHVEVYIPWKGFNNMESKHSWNTLTSKHLAQLHFPGWDKIPDSVKALMARNVRMVFGDKNNSIAMCIITWSKDGASKATEVTKDTGRSSFIIKMASSYGFPIVNVAKQTAENILEKTFGL